jgi:hypothetical protein
VTDWKNLLRSSVFMTFGLVTQVEGQDLGWEPSLLEQDKAIKHERAQDVPLAAHSNPRWTQRGDAHETRTRLPTLAFPAR